jgi:hypothetical protein
LKKEANIMKTILAIALTAGLTLTAGVACSAEPEGRGQVATRVLEITATVFAVDHETRMVTLLVPGGEKITIKADNRVKNLAQVEPGDRLKVEYYESLALRLGAPDDQGAAAAVAIAPHGAKPGVAALETIRLEATVVAIDHENRRVTLKGPLGNTRVLPVHEDAGDLHRIKIGDPVTADYTVGVAVAVWEQL